MENESPRRRVEPETTPEVRAPRYRQLPWVLALLIPLVVLAANPASAGFATYRTVGPSGCDHTTFAAAVLAAALSSEPDIIRVVGSQTNVNLVLSNFDPGTTGPLIIEGGFSSCAVAENPLNQPSGISSLVSTSNAPILDITSSGNSTSIVTLRNLLIGTSGARGVRISNDSMVNIVASQIIQNDGGGIEVSGGADVFIDAETLIANNRDTESRVITKGAGIYCTDNTSTLSLAGRLQDNFAVFGGGLAVEAGCEVTLLDGATITGNSASYGGGVYVITGGEINGGGAGTQGVLIAENVAFEEGGGAWVNGIGSGVFVPNTLFVDNRAADKGGGVHVSNNGRFRTERFNFEPCAAPPRCAEISGNELTSGEEGSAIYADSGAEVIFLQGYLENNVGLQSNIPNIVYATGPGTEVLLEGVQVHGNTTRALFEARDEALIEVAFVSAARNFVVDDSSSTLPSSGGDVTNDATIAIYSSILTDVTGFFSFSGTVDLNCVRTDSISGASTANNVDVSFDPLFRDPENGDLRLLFGSPAVDFCDTAAYSPRDIDAELDGRGYDDPDKQNVLGTYDLGFDEDRDQALFTDGFEGGNTSRWSSSSP